MLHVDDLKYMKLYRKQFYAPVNMEDIKNGSAILLLTPNFNSSIELMKSKFVRKIGNNFNAYYVEKDIMYTINHESRMLQCDHTEDGLKSLNEQTVYTEQTQIDTYGMDLNSYYITDEFCKCGDSLLFFNELYDEEIYNEVTNYNPKYKRMLYNDRIRNNREIFRIYDSVKENYPFIKKTFVDLKKYKSKNLYVDLYYYHEAYLRVCDKRNIIRAIDMYAEFIRRIINDGRITNAGYTKKTVFVPLDWGTDINGSLLNFRKIISPLSVFYKKLRFDKDSLHVFDGIDFIFFGKDGYFKFNTSQIQNDTHVRFAKFIKSLQDSEPIDDTDEPDNSPSGIVSSIVDKLDTNRGIKIHNLTGIDTSSTDKKKEEPKKEINPAMPSEDKTIVDTTEDPQKDIDSMAKEALKSKVVKKIKDASDNATSEDQVLDRLEEDEEFKEMIYDLQDDADDTVKISAARASRIITNRDKFMNKNINNKSIKDLINTSNKVSELPETELPIESINEEWKHLKAINFEETYDVEGDIFKILNSLSDTNKDYPVSILDVSKEDTSTSENNVYTYTAKCEGYNGKRFTLRFDIPKLRDNRFMRLGGNEKVFSIEMPLIPISKTGEETAQIVSFYNKIFIESYNTSTGKSMPSTAKFIKALSKYTDKDIKVVTGNNRKIASKYDLPIDYIDLSTMYTRITYIPKGGKPIDNITIYFNQDDIRSHAKIDNSKGIPYAIKGNGEVLYYGNDDVIMTDLIVFHLGQSFKDLYDAQKAPSKTTYSRASILNTDIPVICILAHDIGLIPAMDLAKIEYDITEKNPKIDGYDVIRLADGYLSYKESYQALMLMNGLKDCNPEEISIKDLNAKMTWVNVLDNFGGRVKSDGLSNFKDLMYDPITVEISRDYQLPETYHEALIYASNLLVDNKMVKHTDISTNRYRTNEVIAAQFYRAISESYKEYALSNKHGRIVPMTMKQSAVLDLIMQQNNTSDLSIFQPLLEIETRNTISTKGVTGMNSDRAYGIDKRGYDDSMVNIIAQATGFASTVGVNRQTTINPNITGGRGYFKQSGVDNMSVTNTFCMTEALSPFAVTSDDPFRNDMTFVQTSKHTTPVANSMPMLVTTGADAAMPYLASDMFAYKAKESGTVIEITDEYMLVKYKSGKTDFIRLDEQTMKNSDGGFYVPLKLKTDLKKGSSFKKSEILAYDPKSFNKSVGGSQLAFSIGTMVKAAIQTTEDGFEDSGKFSEWLSEAMASEIVICKEVNLTRGTNIIQMIQKGTPVKEGDPLLIFNTGFDEDDANILIKNLNNEDGDISTIGRNVIKSKVTGVVSDIKIYRTCDIEELSESLQKIVKKRESEIAKIKKLAGDKANDILLDANYKLPNTGKLKNVDGVLIEFFMKYTDKMAVGDKLVALNANKNVAMDVYKNEDAPYTDFRPHEAIDQITSASSMDGRMVTSIMKTGALNKLMIEMGRKACDIYGVKWKDLHEIKEYFDSQNK